MFYEAQFAARWSILRVDFNLPDWNETGRLFCYHWSWILTKEENSGPPLVSKALSTPTLSIWKSCHATNACGFNLFKPNAPTTSKTATITIKEKARLSSFPSSSNPLTHGWTSIYMTYIRRVGFTIYYIQAIISRSLMRSILYSSAIGIWSLQSSRI